MVPVRVGRVRDNVFELRLTSQELSALMAAARMTRNVLLDDPNAPAEATRLLGRVLEDYDRALAREDDPRDEDGRARRPS